MRRRHSHKHRRDFWRQWRESGPDPERLSEFFRDFIGMLPNKHWMFGGRRFKPWWMGEWRFNPFLSMMLSKGGGLLALYVLHLLEHAPEYGNALMQKITERTGGQWLANPGAIYPLLNMLEDEGLIEGEWEDPDKRTIRRYHITSVGEEELERLKAIVRPKLEEAIQVMSGMLVDLDEE